MRKPILGFLFTTFFLAFTAQAQTNPVHITSGRIFLTNQYGSPNVRLETANFTAVSNLNVPYSPWENVCPYEPRCTPGKTIGVPSQNSDIDLGGCIGDCTQFVSGTFTINGTTYKNAYFDGYLNFPQVGIFIPRVAQRKGFLRLKNSFSMTGHLQVCEISNVQSPCPANRILYEGDIVGKGALTLTLELRMFYFGTTSTPFGWQKSFEYVFE